MLALVQKKVETTHRKDEHTILAVEHITALCSRFWLGRPVRPSAYRADERGGLEVLLQGGRGGGARADDPHVVLLGSLSARDALVLSPAPTLPNARREIKEEKGNTSKQRSCDDSALNMRKDSQGLGGLGDREILRGDGLLKGRRVLGQEAGDSGGIALGEGSWIGGLSQELPPDEGGSGGGKEEKMINNSTTTDVYGPKHHAMLHVPAEFEMT
ncbi:hypothetical protein B0H11DRAFT_1909979 [Mycena galericulata]|nr:hypothetical protein B0H11DRAFT_1909979 [Mycena galericulata]